MRVLVVALLALVAIGCDSSHERHGSSAAAEPDLAALLNGADNESFAVADRPRKFRFPEDHGPHPAFRNEWWYFTGNLRDAAGRRFGYELTIFRFSLTPAPNDAAPSIWATHQVFVGHFAVSDIADERFLVAERLSRAQPLMATARAAPFEVRIQDWSMRAISADPELTWRLVAADEQHGIDLTVTALRPPVLQGNRGWSQKSADPRNSSYYYSVPRWATSGTVRVGDEEYVVAGESWLDREWSTSALADDQAGWDWFALQLDDGSELMYYQLRRRDGAADPYSGGSVRRANGELVQLGRDDVMLTVTDSWTNGAGDVYPSGWQLIVPSIGLDVVVEPAMADQELSTIVRYWEGAVDVRGRSAGTSVGGHGYVELTGYAGASGSAGGRSQ
ncbi:MAG: lipocalin-like domain-containing protein [Pseudomonadota bacterium]